MQKQEPQHIRDVLARADLIKSPTEVAQAADNMAEAITKTLGNLDPLVLCVMNGAVIPTSMLLTRLNFPLRLGYVHATRYQGNTTGGTLEWFAHSRWPLTAEHVLIVDDVF